MHLTLRAGKAVMPVDNHALRVAYWPRYPALLRELREHGGAKHHLERSSDRLTAIDDGIPVGAPVHLVYAPGDFVQLGGLAAVGFEATRPRRRRYEPKHAVRRR